MRMTERLITDLSTVPSAGFVLDVAGRLVAPQAIVAGAL
jgi:hypothetical protein